MFIIIFFENDLLETQPFHLEITVTKLDSILNVEYN